MALVHFIATVRADVVNFEYHLDQLRGEAYLLLLADERLNDVLLPHV